MLTGDWTAHEHSLGRNVFAELLHDQYQTQGLVWNARTRAPVFLLTSRPAISKMRPGDISSEYPQSRMCLSIELFIKRPSASAARPDCLHEQNTSSMGTRTEVLHKEQQYESSTCLRISSTMWEGSCPISCGTVNSGVQGCKGRLKEESVSNPMRGQPLAHAFNLLKSSFNRGVYGPARRTRLQDKSWRFKERETSDDDTNLEFCMTQPS